MYIRVFHSFCRPLFIAILPFSFFLTGYFVPTEAMQVLPADQGKRDQTLNRFRERLKTIATKHDKRGLIAVMSPDISYGLGGGTGIKSFCENWKLNDSNSPFWTRFASCLNHGGYFDEGEHGRIFHMPYYKFYSNSDTGNDENLRALTTGKVSLYAEPSESAKIQRTLAFEVLDVPHDDRPNKWTKISTLDSKVSGWVKTSSLSFSSDNFAELRKVHGRWSLSFFGAQNL